MNVPVLLKVPAERAVSLTRLAHDLQKTLMQRPIVDSMDWRMITIPNLLRVALQVGFPKMDKMSNDQLLSALKAEGVVRGRPRGRKNG